MTKRGIAAFAFAFGASAAIAFGGFAYVRAADEATGYVGKGQIVIRTAIGGTSTVTLGGDVAMEEHGSRIRLDVLSLAIPGTSATISALLGTQLFPPGGFTVVYDRKDSSYSVWASSNQKYYTSAVSTPSPPTATFLSQGSAATSGPDIFAIFAFAKQLRDEKEFTVSLGLAGHQTINGHPATGLNYQYLKTTKDGDTTNVHGTLQFADDLEGVPVEITAAGKTKTIPESALRLDFTSLAKGSPADTDFVPPPGYVRAATVGEVIGKTLPIPTGQ